MRYDAIQESFITGEISPRLLGQVSLDGYKTGAKLVENMVVHPHGGVSRRGGFQYVDEVKDSSKDTILVPLAYRDEFFFILEFGDLYIRFYRAQAKIAATEVTTTYTEAELRDLRFTQDEDSLYIFHKDHVPARLSRVSHTEWNLIPFNDGGVYSVDTIVDTSDHTENTYTAVALTGGGGSGVEATVVVDAGGDITRVTISDPGSGYAINDTLTIPVGTIGGSGPATCDVAALTGDNLPDTWAAGEYPTIGWFFEQRLWTASSPGYPNSIWSSKSAEYFDFDLGTGLDNESIQIIIKDATKIVWGTSSDEIMLGSHNGEFVLNPSTEGSALTPSNIRPIGTTNYGSAFVQPVQVDSNTVFLQRGKRKFRRTEYKFTADKYSAQDITILSEHITNSGVIEIAYANEPDSFIWGLRDDGELIALTYEPEQEIFAWHRHTIGGTGATVESIAVSDGVEVHKDEVWAINKRTIDGGTVRYVEFMAEGLSPEDDQEDAIFLDSAVTKTGSDFTTFDGLDHLEGETVSILADGAVQAPKVVASGEITLDTAADKAHAGLSYSSYLDPLPPEGGNPIGTSQGKLGRIITIALRMYRSLGFQIGEIGGTFDTPPFGPTELMDTAPDLFTGITEPIPYPGGHDRNIDMRIIQEDPLPLNILAIMYEASTK